MVDVVVDGVGSYGVILAGCILDIMVDIEGDCDVDGVESYEVILVISAVWFVADVGVIVPSAVLIRASVGIGDCVQWACGDPTAADP